MSEIKGPAGLAPSEGSEGESAPGLSSFGHFSGNLWHFLSGRNITLISAFIVTWCFPESPICLQISPFYEDTTYIELGSTLMT